MELLISIVVGILIIEAYAWLPRLSDWLLQLAINRLPIAERERCLEDWKANLGMLPNTIVRLFHALSLIGAANKISADVVREKCDRIERHLEKFVDLVSDARVRDVYTPYCVDIDRLKQEVQEKIVRLRQIGCASTDQIDSLERRCEDFINTAQRERDIMKASSDAAVLCAAELRKTIADKHLPTITRFRRRELPINALPSTMQTIVADISTRLRGLTDFPEKQFEITALAMNAAFEQLREEIDCLRSV
jgi:hypothetical protein